MSPFLSLTEDTALLSVSLWKLFPPPPPTHPLQHAIPYITVGVKKVAQKPAVLIS